MPRSLTSAALASSFVLTSLLLCTTQGQAKELRIASEPEEYPRGTYLGISLETAYLQGDVYAVSRPAMGYLSKDFDLVLTLPIEWRLVDLQPADTQPLLFGALRPASYVAPGERLGPASLTRILKTLRVGHAGDLFYLRGGDLSYSQGHGSSVWRFASSPDPDRRHAGLATQLGNELLGIEWMIGDMLAPQNVSSARAYVRPLLLLDSNNGVLNWFATRLAFSAGYAADFFAPYPDNKLNGTTSIVQVLGDSELMLLEDPRWRLAGYLDLAGRRSYANHWGHGEELGLLSQVNLWGAQLSLRLGLRQLGQNYRASEFDTFYMIERQHSFADGRPLAMQMNPPGWGGVIEVDLSPRTWLHLRLQYDDSDRLHRGKALVGAEFNLGPVHAAAALAQRAFDGPLALLHMNDKTVALAELNWSIYGPLSMVGRYWRTLRQQEQNMAMDNDIMIGLEVSCLLQ